MNSYEIRNNIRYNENLIDQYYSEKAGIVTKIEELEQLQKRFTTFQNEFCEIQDHRQLGLTKFSQTTISNKIIPSYISGMNALLRGAEFNNAYHGLTAAKSKVESKRQELLQELRDCEGRISYRESRKLYWQEQLRYALMEEAANGR